MGSLSAPRRLTIGLPEVTLPGGIARSSIAAQKRQ